MKKKVLLLIPGLEFGGAQRSFTRLSFLLEEYFEVYIVLFNTDAEIAFDYGGKLISLDVPAGDSFFKKMWYFFLRCYKVRKIKKKHGIYSSISYMDGANFVNILSKAKDTVIISVRGSQFHDETIKGVVGFLRLRILIPFLYFFADKIVALNEGIKKELLSYKLIPSNKINVISNYYDFPTIENKAREGLEEEFKDIFKRKVIITAGRLAPEKGYQYLIEVYAEFIKCRRDSVHLVILGDGPFRSTLIAKSKELGLSICDPWQSSESKLKSKGKSTVYFLGYQKNPYKYLRNSSVFVLTSSSEGGPNVLSEAMVCGIPIVSVDCPSGPRENLSLLSRPTKDIVKAEYAEYGILMPMLNNPSINFDSRLEWVQVLSSLVDDPHLQSKYSIKGKEKVKSLSKETVSKKWINLIKS